MSERGDRALRMDDGDFYSFNNLDKQYFGVGTGDYQLQLNHSSWNKYGYFGEIRFDYKKVIQVSATGRMDGSSRFKQSTSVHAPSRTASMPIFMLLIEWQQLNNLNLNGPLSRMML